MADKFGFVLLMQRPLKTELVVLLQDVIGREFKGVDELVDLTGPLIRQGLFQGLVVTDHAVVVRTDIEVLYYLVVHLPHVDLFGLVSKELHLPDVLHHDPPVEPQLSVLLPFDARIHLVEQL